MASRIRRVILTTEVVPVFLDRSLRWIPERKRRHRDGQEETAVHAGVQGASGAGGVAAAFNLGLVMRSRFGFGTPRGMQPPREAERVMSNMRTVPNG